MSPLILLSRISLLTLLCFFAAADAVVNYLHHNCTSNTTFNSNDAYRFNLNTLLYSLTSATAEFYNTTAGNTDAAYGLFMCRGDVPNQLCRECVSNATNRLTSDSECLRNQEGVIWYDECLVRFSDRSFFSALDVRPKFVMQNDSRGSNDEESLNRVVAKTMNDTVVEAVRSGPQGTKKFAMREEKLSESEWVYSVAQCTPDLSEQDCNTCLRDVVGDIFGCCLGKQGGRVLYPSCNIRYELYPFYNAQPQPPSPSSSVIPIKGKAKGLSSRIIIILVVVIIVVALLLSCFAYCFLRRKRIRSYKAILKENFGSDGTTLESLLMSLATIEAATTKFSQENKIGRGGFGEVYKGILPDGREIAVKKLSKNSGQGAKEFKNEILLIAKLQHRNLVALLGFCLEEEEKILVYEYVTNKSLDYFLFGSQRQRILSWPERYKIIGGTARGILYLHEYSRLKVIHRDLKPSNILLDDEMNPKISDFGMAKMVAINESEGSTNRIVGTYGYMSPEYAILGQYSEKSDVFSFGVIVLEMISGKKNASCHESQYVDGLLSYAWKQWRDEKLSEILDSNIREVGSYDEVIKCIRIGLLCVQENPDARPSMATVVSYLSNDSIQLPNPQEPAFFMHGRTELTIGKKESTSSDQYTNNPCSVNEMSISKFFPR